MEDLILIAKQYGLAVAILLTAIWWLKNKLERIENDRKEREKTIEIERMKREEAERKTCAESINRCENQHTEAITRIRVLEDRGHAEHREDSNRLLKALELSAKAVEQFSALGFKLSNTPPDGNEMQRR